MNQAYVSADELLKNTYCPEKGTVITFLNCFLRGKVSYAYGKSQGWRYRKSKWKKFISDVDVEDLSSNLANQKKGEYPVNLTSREKEVIQMRIGGHSLLSIANHFGYKSPNTVTYWFKHHIVPKFIDAGIQPDEH